jgi:cytochrome c-type biogenesis protein CcmE
MRGRARYVIAAVLCAGVVVFMLVVLQKNVVYLKPVSEAVRERDDQGTRRFRMGGAVVPGTIAERDGGAEFELTEGGVVARVTYNGSPPDLFADCAPVVVEGHWQGATFVSDRLLIKHGNEYEPPSGDYAQQCPEEPEGVRG